MNPKRKKFLIIAGGIAAGIGVSIFLFMMFPRAKDVEVILPKSILSLAPSLLQDKTLDVSKNTQVQIFESPASDSSDEVEVPSENEPLQSIQVPQEPKPPKPTEEEIFNKLWPLDYRDFLTVMQDLMIKDGFMAAEARISLVDTDEKVYSILLKTTDYAEKQGWVVAEDAEKLRRGVSISLRAAIDEERKAYREGRTPISILPRDQNISRVWYGKQFFVEDVIRGLKYVLSIQTANAGWHTSPDCYKDNNPEYTVPGFNAWSFCCDCGLNWRCSSVGCICVYKEHCGPGGCDCANFGCLNNVCGWGPGPAFGPEHWPNAIWDSLGGAFGTGICGCG